MCYKMMFTMLMLECPFVPCVYLTINFVFKLGDYIHSYVALKTNFWYRKVDRAKWSRG